MTQIVSGNFSARGHLPLTQKDSSTHAWSCSLVKEGLPFEQDLSLENSTDSYLSGFYAAKFCYHHF